MSGFRFVFAASAAALLAGVVRAEPVAFTDIDSFRAAAGELIEINFDIRPDNLPLRNAVEITPTFNFADWGVIFSAVGPLLQSTDANGSVLRKSTDPTPVEPWDGPPATHFIAADFLSPVSAVGIMVPQAVTLTVFDVQDRLVATLSNGENPSDSFIGVVSDVPLGRVVANTGSYLTVFDSVHLAFMPEPPTLILLAFGLAAIRRRRNRE